MTARRGNPDKDRPSADSDRPSDDPSDRDSVDFDLPLIPRAPKLPLMLEPDDPSPDSTGDRPSYSLRPQKLTPQPPVEVTGYSVAPPAATGPATSGYSMRPGASVGAQTEGPPGTSLPANLTIRPSTRAPARVEKRGEPPPSSRRGRSKLGRMVAFALCILFAIIGAVPVFAALLVRSRPVQDWASRETARIIEQEVGARATYDVRVQPWPLIVAVENLAIEGDDDKGDFLTVERASMRPRIFSLMAGKLDVGEVEVTGAHARVVVRDGELVSFKPKEQKPSEPSKGPERAPFRALALTDASLDLDIDGTLVLVREVDLDIVAEPDGAFELGVRAGGASVTRKHEAASHPGQDAVDEDRLCRFEARARFDAAKKQLLIRRLALGAVVDFDPDPGTRPSCTLEEHDWRRVDVRLGALELPASLLDGEGLSVGGGFALVSGRVAARLPAGVVHRFVDFPHVSGMVDVDVEAHRAPLQKLPLLSGHVHAEFIGLDGKVFSDRFDAHVAFDDMTLNASDIKAKWADGDFVMQSARLSFKDPRIRLDVRNIVADGVEMQGLLRDLGVHPQSHVGWQIAHVEFEEFGGTLIPLGIEGKLVARTANFGIYDRPSHLPDRQRMITLDRADVRGTLAVRPNAVMLERMHAVTPGSNIFTTVKLGYLGDFGIEVPAGSYVDLAEISPLVSVQIAGKTHITAQGSGPYENPRIEGDIKVDGFELGGFKAGDIRTAHAIFVPLSLELSQVELLKNQSLINSSITRIAFDQGPDVLVDSELSTSTAPHLKIRDFFEVFRFDEDPRFDSIAGTARGSASVHYAIGGSEDRCGGGFLDIHTKMEVDRPELFGESFERGNLDVDFRWEDSDAGSNGMDIRISHASVQDGSGSITAQAEVQLGGKLRGTAVAAGMPLSRLEGFGALRDYLDGEVSAIATLGGSLSGLAADVDVSITPLRFGANKLPSSRLFVRLEPDPREATRPMLLSTCGHATRPVVDEHAGKTLRQIVALDLPSGQFRIEGQLFGDQVVIKDLTVSNQSAKIIAGQIALTELDVGTILGALPSYALGGQPPGALLSADIDLQQLETANLAATKAVVVLHSIDVKTGGRTVTLGGTTGPMLVKNGDVELPQVKLELADKSGLAVGFTAEGKVLDVFSGDRRVDASLAIAPFDLATLRDDLPGVDRIAGMLSGAVKISGDLAAPRVNGYAKLRDGSLAVTGIPSTLEQISVDVTVGDGELRVTKASANVGAGTIDVTGRIPIVGLGIGTGTATITARGVKLPVGDDIEVVADADLDATIPGSTSAADALPEVNGTVSLTSFAYKRPIALSLDLGELSRSIGRVEVDGYDPDGDFLRFALRIVSPRPLIVRNDLADIRLEIVEPGIELAGTNQRYGAKGELRVLPDSKLRLRNHEFDVREGYVRFADPTKVKADIDVRATTEMRRYASADSAPDGTAGATSAGQWDVSVHAHGTTDDMKLDLSSDPPMDQEDIVLLLTVGMTRAEIDRGLATSLGETVGLEALSALTGADKAVKSVVPIIDYFHFGSSYSSRTGRTEPNVTVGKRLTDDIRASVTTTLTERDVAATIEWRLKKGVSVQGSYDNTNDIGTIIGNLGADLRWRLEFE